MTMRLLQYSDLKARGIRWSKVWIHKLEQRGGFPQRVTLGQSTVCWIEEEIDAWMQAQAGKRRPIGRPRKHPRPEDQTAIPAE
jgi:predicted DNA-binding transcriptional regulator AlpA